MPQTVYREASYADAPVIVEFQIAMAHETEGVTLDAETCALGVNAVFADPSKGRYFVAEVDNTPVASTMITYEWSDWRNGLVWWIQSVYVKPEFRRKGVYAGLYDHIKAIVEGDQDLRGVRLYVDTRNINAQQVYARLGMNGDHYRVFEWMKS